MCLILIAYQMHPQYPLIIAANRDEYYHRPSLGGHYWQDYPNIFAGRDLSHGGTWLGVNSSGHLAAITNYRTANPKLSAESSLRSRGHLTRDFLKDNIDPVDYLAHVHEQKKLFRPFNLVFGSLNHLYFISNAEDNPHQLLKKGIYGLSNHLLDTPWPKVINGKKALAQSLDHPMTPDNVLSILKDSTIALDQELPQTGLNIEYERMLSPSFIKGIEYGTRTSTALLYPKNGPIIWKEEHFSAHGKKMSVAAHEIHSN